MPNKLGIKGFKSNFTEENAENVELAATLAYMADSINKGGWGRSGEEFLKLTKVAVPFVAYKVGNDKYAIFHGFNIGEANFPVTQVMTPEEARNILKGEDFLNAIDTVETSIQNFETKITTIHALLNTVQLKAFRNLLPYKQTRIDGKPLPSLLDEEQVKRDIKNLKELIVSQENVQRGIEAIINEVTSAFTKQLQSMQKELDTLIKSKDAKLKKKQAEIDAKIKKLETEMNKAIEKSYKEAKDQNLKSLKELPGRFSQHLTKDLNEVQSELKRLLDFAKKLNDPEKGFDDLAQALTALHDQSMTFAQTVATAIHTIEDEKSIAEDRIANAQIDEREYRDKFDQQKEEIQAEYTLLEELLTKEIEDLEQEIQVVKEREAQFKETIPVLMNQTSNMGINLSTYFINAESLGATTETKITVYIPVWVGIMGKGRKTRYVTLPPVILPDNLSKPKQYEIVSPNNGIIGFRPLAENVTKLFDKQFHQALNNNGEITQAITAAKNFLEGSSNDSNKFLLGIQLIKTQLQAPKQISKLGEFLVEHFKTTS